MSDKTYQQGVEDEQDRFIQLLIDFEVIRDSMLGIDWQVVYTENGPKDISWAELLGQTK